MRSDDYIRRVLTARKNAKKEDEPEKRFGSGNLACVAYTGGKPHSRRRPYYKVADLRAADSVQSDVNLLSYYAKNRQAAASACEFINKKKKLLTKTLSSSATIDVFIHFQNFIFLKILRAMNHLESSFHF